jgi:hypothetical protein
MRVLLKLVLDCDPDDAWRAVQSPAVMQAVSAPFMRFRSLEPGGFPETWSEGDHPVSVSAFGVVPAGEQVIRIALSERSGGIRVMKDTGRGLSGLVASVTAWDHTLAVSSAGGGRTLYRDQLVFEVGGLSVLAWPVYWVFWQWRAARMKQLAPTWSVQQ